MNNDLRPKMPTPWPKAHNSKKASLIQPGSPSPNALNPTQQPKAKRSIEVFFFKACAAQLRQGADETETLSEKEAERERETEPQRKPHGGQRRGYVSSKFTSTWTIIIKLLLRILPLFNYYDDSYTTGAILILLRGWYTATMLLPLLLLLLYNIYIYICIYI